MAPSLNSRAFVGLSGNRLCALLSARTRKHAAIYSPFPFSDTFCPIQGQQSLAHIFIPFSHAITLSHRASFSIVFIFLLVIVGYA